LPTIFLTDRYKEMAVNSSAHCAKAGYNQSGGGYFYVVADTAATLLNVYTPGSGSGGATTVGSFALATPGSAAYPAGVSTLFKTGNIVKDMGKTVVSSSRVFRKIQAVDSSDATAKAAFGVTGGPDNNYASYYVELGREGSGTPVPLVRYM
jgi:hypothetical protein